jgi:seryl-tRNA synthetase
MTTKDYLSQAYRIDQRINSKLEQVQSLRELATKATATLNDSPVSGSRNVHSMSDIIDKMIDLENEINDDIDQLVDLKREIMTVIKRVENPEHQTLLELRYLCFKSWEHIAVAMNYNSRHVFKMHDAALQKVDATRIGQ